MPRDAHLLSELALNLSHRLAFGQSELAQPSNWSQFSDAALAAIQSYDTLLSSTSADITRELEAQFGIRVWWAQGGFWIFDGHEALPANYPCDPFIDSRFLTTASVAALLAYSRSQLGALEPRQRWSVLCAVARAQRGK